MQTLCSGAGNPRDETAQTRQFCNIGPKQVVVYQAWWCKECREVSKTLEKYKDTHALEVTELVVEDRAGVPRHAVKRQLQEIFKDKDYIYYPYIILCGKPLGEHPNMDDALRDALGIPRRERVVE